MQDADFCLFIFSCEKRLVVGKHLSEGKDLVDWLENEDILIRLSVNEADILLGYLVGSGYSLEVDKGQLYLYDEGNSSQEETDIDQVVDKVCDTNYTLIQHTAEQLAHAEFHEDTTELESSLMALYLDEIKLDQIFDRTKYRKGNRNISFIAVNGEIKSDVKGR